MVNRSLKKLRFVITTIFLLSIISLGITFFADYIENQRQAEFEELLTDYQVEMKEWVYKNYPDNEDLRWLYAISGLLLITTITILLLVTIKIWSIEEI